MSSGTLRLRLFELQEGTVGISPGLACVFLVDSLETLGYTLAGFDGGSVVEGAFAKRFWI